MKGKMIEAVQTLIDCYGQPDEDYIIKFLTENKSGSILLDPIMEVG